MILVSLLSLVGSSYASHLFTFTQRPNSYSVRYSSALRFETCKFTGPGYSIRVSSLFSNGPSRWELKGIYCKDQYLPQSGMFFNYDAPLTTAFNCDAIAGLFDQSLSLAQRIKHVCSVNPFSSLLPIEEDKALMELDASTMSHVLVENLSEMSRNDLLGRRDDDEGYLKARGDRLRGVLHAASREYLSSIRIGEYQVRTDELGYLFADVRSQTDVGRLKFSKRSATLRVNCPGAESIGFSPRFINFKVPILNGVPRQPLPPPPALDFKSMCSEREDLGHLSVMFSPQGKCLFKTHFAGNAPDLIISLTPKGIISIDHLNCNGIGKVNDLSPLQSYTETLSAQVAEHLHMYQDLVMSQDLEGTLDDGSHPTVDNRCVAIADSPLFSRRYICDIIRKAAAADEAADSAEPSGAEASGAAAEPSAADAASADID